MSAKAIYSAQKKHDDYFVAIIGCYSVLIQGNLQSNIHVNFNDPESQYPLLLPNT
jgi:hypothetical protein